MSYHGFTHPRRILTRPAHQLSAHCVQLSIKLICAAWLVQLLGNCACGGVSLLSDVCPAVVSCSMEWGGSNIRPEATGYGAVYFGEEILKEQGDSFKVRHTS